MMAEGSPTTPLLGLRQMIASGLNLIAYQERMVDGARRMTRISEVAGLQGDTILLNDIFEFRQTGMKDGKILGYHTPTGYIPRFLPRFQMAGIDLPVQEFFTPR
jgi:pilus assembly protein CpaF